MRSGPFEGEAQAEAARLGVGAVFTDFDSLLEMPGLEALSINAPIEERLGMTLAELRAGNT
jgi:predicted dehydrogenase